MNNPDEGATKAPEHTVVSTDKCIAPDGRVRAHTFKWVWEGKKMTDKVFCSTCGQIRKNIHSKPFTLEGEQQ